MNYLDSFAIIGGVPGIWQLLFKWNYNLEKYLYKKKTFYRWFWMIENFAKILVCLFKLWTYKLEYMFYDGM